MVPVYKSGVWDKTGGTEAKTDGSGWVITDRKGI